MRIERVSELQFMKTGKVVANSGIVRLERWQLTLEQLWNWRKLQILADQADTIMREYTTKVDGVIMTADKGKSDAFKHFNHVSSEASNKSCCGEPNSFRKME